MSSAKPQLEAFSLLFPLSLSETAAVAVNASLFPSPYLCLIPFIAPLLFFPSPHHSFGNVIDRQHYSDVIVLITTSGRKRDSPLACVVSGLVWSSV